MPSYAELMQLYNYKTKSAAYYIAQKLIESGYIQKDTRGKLIPTSLLTASVHILGTVQAGFPSASEELVSDRLTLDEFLIDNQESTYILTVSGDSMIDAGIFEGDMVLVDRSKTPQAGDIVIAEVDNAWTMKYLRKKGNNMWLEAANENYDLIYPEEELSIAAVVTAVIRKY